MSAVHPRKIVLELESFWVAVAEEHHKGIAYLSLKNELGQRVFGLIFFKIY